MHANTVAQRLERVGQLLGDGWRDPARALDVQLALRMRRLPSMTVRLAHTDRPRVWVLSTCPVRTRATVASRTCLLPRPLPSPTAPPWSPAAPAASAARVAAAAGRRRRPGAGAGPRRGRRPRRSRPRSAASTWSPTCPTATRSTRSASVARARRHPRQQRRPPARGAGRGLRPGPVRLDPPGDAARRRSGWPAGCSPGCTTRGWGRLVHVSSVHGHRASPYKSAYVSAKHGLEGLSKVIALEGAEQGRHQQHGLPGLRPHPAGRGPDRRPGPHPRHRRGRGARRRPARPHAGQAARRARGGGRGGRASCAAPAPTR